MKTWVIDQREEFMLAYHNDPTQKDAILAKLSAHRLADELVKGQYWENGKGCAVGCTIESGNHAEYEPRFGIPRILARLEDRIFEGLPNGSAKEWPEQFMGAIRPGADLSMVWPRFALWLLTEELPQFAKREKTKLALSEVGVLYREWCETAKNPEPHRWVKARKTATAAATAAYDASAAAYAAASAAAYAAEGKAYQRFAEKLIELLEAA
jgi:hypothetical protein